MTNTEKTMSLDEFIATYAPPAFEVTRAIPDLNAAVLEMLTDEQRQLVEKSRRFFKGNAIEFNVPVHGTDASEIRSQEQAVYNLRTIEERLTALHEAIDKVNALKSYYMQAAAILAATEKVPAYTLSRNTDRYGDKHITFTIRKGYFDKTIGKLVMEGRPQKTFTGKEHRDARKAFERMVKNTLNSVGYEISNDYTSHVKFDEYAIKA